MKTYKVHEYKGFTIQNVPYHSEPRWFVKNEKYNVKVSPFSTLRDAKEFIDGYLQMYTDKTK